MVSRLVIWNHLKLKLVGVRLVLDNDIIVLSVA